jgi:hypothetical protein
MISLHSVKDLITQFKGVLLHETRAVVNGDHVVVRAATIRKVRLRLVQSLMGIGNRKAVQAEKSGNFHLG